MRSASPSPEATQYRSTADYESAVRPGVQYEILRPSFVRRTELTRALFPIVQRLEQESAGESVADRCAAARSLSLIEIELLKWGLQSVEGLTIDGLPATPATVWERGPEDLCREIVGRIRQECGLTGEERKN